MALEHKLPEYRGILATVGNQPAPTVEKPEFKLSSLEKVQTPETPVQVAKEDKRLPETGENSQKQLFSWQVLPWPCQQLY